MGLAALNVFSGRVHVQRLRGEEMRNGPYILVIAPPGYPGKKYRERYAYEHHIVWWKKHGEVLPKGMVLHHVDGDHRNNKFKNLELLTGHEHRVRHGQAMRQKTLCLEKCFNCGMSFTLGGSQSRRRKKNNSGNRLFCGRSCQVKTQQRERWG